MPARVEAGIRWPEPIHLIFASVRRGLASAGLHFALWSDLHFMFLIFLAAGLIAAVLNRAWLQVLACTGVLRIGAVFLANAPMRASARVAAMG